MQFYSENGVNLYQGKMQDILTDNFEKDSVDSIVTDPPYELNFMGKGWDNAGVSFNKETWKKCFDVLKPGGYLLAFGGSRTFHRIACAIEDAGFEIRDTIMWLYGSGFPKSMNIGLAIDKKNGVESKVVGKTKIGKTSLGDNSGWDTSENMKKIKQSGEYEIKQATNEWNGWGTCLKPAFEPVIVARKPFKGSLVDNVIEYGVGGLNIDECRVEFGKETDNRVGTKTKRGDSKKYKYNKEDLEILQDFEQDFDFVWSEETAQWGTIKDFRNWLFQYFMENIEIDFNIYDYGRIVIDTDRKKVIPLVDTFKNILNSSSMFGVSNIGVQMYKDNGRFPANVILTYDETDFDEVCGGFPSEKGNSASRYFYCAKASKKDRDEGLEEFKNVSGANITGRKENSAGLVMEGGKQNPFAGKASPNNKNTHPTVKPTTLMQYLVRLVTPKGGTILDPFMGSGSTGKAVAYENKERNGNYKFIGIELNKEYCDIAKARLNYVINKQNYEEVKQKARYQQKGVQNIFELLEEQK